MVSAHFRRNMIMFRMGMSMFSNITFCKYKNCTMFSAYFPSDSQFTCSRNFCISHFKPKTYRSDQSLVSRKSHFQVSCMTQQRSFTITSILSKKKKSNKLKAVQTLEDAVLDIEAEVLDDPDFDALRNEADILSFIGSELDSRFDIGVIVLQPWVKWGPRMKQNTTSQRMLDEAAALISTLPGIRIIHKEVLPVRSTDGNHVFGPGTLDRLRSFIRSSQEISSVFISVNVLKNVQVEALEQAFGLRVMDRYSVVLSIFRQHARTKEAKLQVALAELRYVNYRKKLDIHEDKVRLMVMERQKRLKKALDAIAGIRAHKRQNRLKADIPSVAVVGYTNAGKTTLIHALTGDERAKGKNQLFATLDVTAHGGRLSCGLEVLFIDTVGFIQDMPSDLIASFRATLEDAICADVIVHIRDASHPDYDLQGLTVEETLSSLPVPKETPIITVANKTDLGIVKSEEHFTKVHLVSSTTGQGLQDLMADIEKKVLKTTGRQYWRFSLPTGSEEIRWLRKATGLASEDTDPENPQMTTVVAVMTDKELAAFRRNFK